MSEITTAYDAIVSHMDTLLPSGSGYFRLRNPYIANENPDAVLVKGYGVAMLGARNTNRVVSDQHSLMRDVLIILTRRVLAKDFEITTKDTGVKNLLEDHAIVVKSAKNIQNFGTGAVQFKYDSDGGIQFVRELDDGFKFIKIETLFKLEYIESI